jgi:molecular chaperone GrpE
VSNEAHAREQGGSALDDRSPEDDADATPAGDAAAPAEDTVAQLEDRLRRALADLDNLRKRYEREVARERLSIRMQVSLQWLPVVDDLERAIAHLQSSGDCGPEVVEGVRVIRDRALSVLAQLGFPRFDATGEGFDPARHEAVSVIDRDEPPGTVVATTRTGYGAGELVLRPAGVVVARAPAPDVRGAGNQDAG